MFHKIWSWLFGSSAQEPVASKLDTVIAEVNAKAAEPKKPATKRAPAKTTATKTVASKAPAKKAPAKTASAPKMTSTAKPRATKKSAS